VPRQASPAASRRSCRTLGTMRLIAAPLLFVLCWSGSATAAGFVGLWFSCVPEWQARSPHALLEISREGSGYRWLHEWGEPYSASGLGSVEGGKLVLRGCKSYRGETEQGCDRSDPPVHVVLDDSLLVHQQRNLKESLRRSRWIKTDAKNWQHLARRCEAFRDEMDAQKIPSTK